MKTIIFICTGNTCRSPMAEALFKLKLGDNSRSYNVFSRGFSPIEDEPAAQNAIEAIKDFGADLSGHKAKALTIEELKSADLLGCMTMEHKRVLMLLGADESRIKVLGISDPYMSDLSVYKKCAKEIDAALDNILAELQCFQVSLMPIEHAEFAAKIESVSLGNEAWSESAIKETISLGGCYFAAYKGSEMVGVLGVKLVLDEAYILNISVLPSFRRMGIGSLLLKAASKYLEEKNAAFLSLEVRDSNNAAISLYKKLGFCLNGVRKNFYSSPKEDARIMTLYFR